MTLQPSKRYYVVSYRRSTGEEVAFFHDGRSVHVEIDGDVVRSTSLGTLWYGRMLSHREKVLEYARRYQLDDVPLLDVTLVTDTLHPTR